MRANLRLDPFGSAFEVRVAGTVQDRDGHDLPAILLGQFDRDLQGLLTTGRTIESDQNPRHLLLLPKERPSPTWQGWANKKPPGVWFSRGSWLLKRKAPTFKESLVSRGHQRPGCPGGISRRTPSPLPE